MKKILSVTAAAVMALVFAACDNMGGSSEPVELTFNLQPGSTYRYIMENHQTSTTDVQGMSVSINQDMRTEVSYNVLAKEGNATRVQVTYDRITMKTSGGGVNSTFDSDSAQAGDAMYGKVKQMVKQPFEMTIGPNGEIMSINGIDRITGMDSTAFAGAMTDSMLRTMMQQSLTIYPGQKVKPGDTWIRSYSATIGFMKLNFKNNYTLKDVKNGIAHIEVKADINLNRPDSTEGMLDMEIEGVQTGTLDVDIATGLIKESKLQQQIKGKVSMPNLDVEAPITATSTVEITGSKVK